MPARGGHPDGGTYRLFIAVDPPLELAAELAGWARAQHVPGSGLRVMAPESIHLTLAFLGERAASDAGPISGAIDTAVTEWSQAGGPGPVELELGPPAWLPPRHPRALAIEVRDAAGRLAALREALGESLANTLGWHDERRRFRPHLTTGRLSGRPIGPVPLEPTPPGTFAVDEAVLYRSFLDPAGARYEALDSVRLT